MDTNIKEVKIIMHFCLQNMPEVNTKTEIADAISRLVHEDPQFFGQLDEDNIVDVREYVIRSTRSPNDE
jgi:uncharacterized protein YuzB (UPF0349 family)